MFNMCVESMTDYLSENCQTQKEFDEQFDKYFTEDFLTKMYKLLINSVPGKVFNFWLDECSKYYKEDQEENFNFQEYLENIWGHGFELSNLLYSVILDELDSYSRRLETEHKDDLPGNKYKCKVLQLLANRNLQTYASILCLMQNGFGDQAFMLFRNMFENSIFSKFIFESNEQTAKAFYEAQNKDIKSKDDFSWVRYSNRFDKNERISFKKIFEKCKFEKNYADIWYGQYKLACKLLHTTPQGTSKTLCSNPTADEMFSLVGQSPFGLNLAGEHSAIILEESTRNYLCLFYDEKSLVFTVAIHKWIGEIRNVYYEITKKFQEDSDNSKQAK